MSDPFASLVTKTGPRQRLGISGRPFDPVRIGFPSTSGCPTPTCRRCTSTRSCWFEEAVAEGHTIRPLELVVERAFALPQNRWENALHGLRRLREAGCVGVIGPLVSDNARTLREAINAEIQLPCVTWAGTSDWYGDYCFRLGNGGCTEEGQMMASWLAHRGIRRVGVMSEISPNGQEYFLSFRRAAAELGLEIRGVETITQTPTDLEQRLENLRDCGAEGPRLHGLRLPDPLMRPMFERLAWDPPAHHDHGLPVLLREPGLDEGARRLGRHRPGLRGESATAASSSASRSTTAPAPSPNTVPVLAYDRARLHRGRAPLRRRAHRLGRQGRPRAHPLRSERHGRPAHPIGAAPDDHNLFHGDWLLYRRVVEETKPGPPSKASWTPNV
jgi:hypothetical protein